MNLADKIEVITGEPDAAEEILGLTAEEVNLLSDPLANADFGFSVEDQQVFVEALLNPPEPNEALKAARDRYVAQSPQSAQLDEAVPSGRIAHIPAVDRQVDPVLPARVVDVTIGSNRYRNPA
jgi:hypothetical protein